MLIQAIDVSARKRVEEHFSWDAIGERTVEFYEKVIGR